MKKILFYNLLILSIALSACQHQAKQSSAKQAKVITPADKFSSCPYLSKSGGRLILSWLQQDSAEGTAEMYYAVWDSAQHQFSGGQAIPTTNGAEPHGENMPKILWQKDNNLLAVFDIKNPQPGNAYTGAVYYTSSNDGGKNWTKSQPLMTSDSSFDQRYFDIGVLPDGHTGIVWLNNSRPKGSTLYFSKMDDKKFTDPKVIGRHTCQCCRTALLMDQQGRINVAYREIYHDSIRDMAYCYSTDNGKTFSTPERISADNWVINGCPHTGPTLAAEGNNIDACWYTMGGVGGGIYFAQAARSDNQFSKRISISRNITARHPQMIALPDGNVLITWDESAKKNGHYYYHIGLEQRQPDGTVVSRSFITADSINANYPEFKLLDNRQVLVAYTQRKGNNSRITYQVLKL